MSEGRRSEEGVTLTSRCRACGATELEAVLELGRLPLANALLDPAQLDPSDLREPEPRYPLTLVLCAGCGLAQLDRSIDPARLFTDYPYASSVSRSIVEHAEALTAALLRERAIEPGQRVIELASNDGYLLRNYSRAGIDVLGIDPARNLAELARREHGVPTLAEPFGLELAERLRAEGVRADLLHAHNVLAHVPELVGFVRGIERLLAEGGLALLEFPYVVDLVEGLAFDTLYHEHLCYFALAPLARLLEREGLVVAEVERIPIHGGSLRLRVRRASEGARPGPSVARLLEEEARLGVGRPEYFRSFERRIRERGEALLGLLRRLAAEGHTLAAYGASAKGTTLLGTFGVGRELLAFVADKSPLKQGRLTPGTHLPIVPPGALLERMPAYVLLLCWNLAEEVIAQEAEYLRRGGRFLVPLPELRVVESAG